MAQITIGDLTGTAQIDVSDTSLAGKNQLTALETAASEVMAALPKPVTDATFKDEKFAAAWENPAIPLKGNTVDAKASVNSTLSVSRDADSPLFGDDDYDKVVINQGECWAAFELDTLLDASVAVPLPEGFGVSFEASTAPNFATYVLIPAAEAPTTTLKQAIERTLDNFGILDSSDAVLSIPQGVIYTSDVSGTVKVGGSWKLPLSVNQFSLADAKLPFDSSISVSPSLTVGVEGDIAITSEFSVRFRRTAANLLRIGLYRNNGVTYEATFTGSAGLTADSGNADLINEFFTAVDPGIDTSKLADGDAANIQQVLNDSIDRSLALSFSAGWSDNPSDAAAMVYEVDISAKDQPTKDAIDAALSGDWTGITKLPNARKLRNVIIDTVDKTFTFTVNILGLYNYRSVADFVATMRVCTDLEHGSVVITDSATATLIVTASTQLAADPDRLRAALYEGFVATATYKALLAGTGVDPTFGATQNYILYKDSMGYGDALKQLNTGEALGVMPIAVKTGLPAKASAVKHARFSASCTYGNNDVLKFFFSDIAAMTPRTSNDLKKIARNVLASLLDAQDPTDQQRIEVLASDEDWAKMDANPAQIVAPFYSDWFDITEWAPAIAKVAPLLADTIRYAKTVAGDPTADPKFMKKRAALALALDGATHNTKAAFNQNFPICVMATLAGLTSRGANAPTFQAGWNGVNVFHAPMAVGAK